MSTYTITDTPFVSEERASTFPSFASSQQRRRQRAPSAESLPFAAQIREMNRHVVELTQTVSAGVNESNVQRRQIEQLEVQLVRIERERTTAMGRLESCERKNAALKAEAEKMKLLAIGATGVVTGLGAGLAYGITGPNLIACGVAGGAVTIAGRELYIHVIGE